MVKNAYPGVSEQRDGLRIRFTWQGQRYQPVLPWTPTPTNKARAARLYAEIKGLIKTGVFTHAKLVEFFPEYGSETQEESPIFAAIAQDYLDTADVSPNTRNEYRKILTKYWMPELAALPVTEIKPSTIKRIAAATAWSSAKTKNNALSVLRQTFETAVDDEILDANPAGRIKNAKHQKQPPDPFTLEEADLIIKELYRTKKGYEVVYAAFYEFSFFTGMRASEAMALQWGDIDWRKKVARVEKAHSKGRVNDRTKTAVIRDVKLNERAMNALLVMKEWTFLQGGHIFLSPRFKKTPWRSDKGPRPAFTAALKKLGIRHRPAKNTRHTYATIMLMSNMNPAFCAKQLGHSLQVFLNVYSAWISSDQDELEMGKLQIGHKVVTDKKESL